MGTVAVVGAGASGLAAAVEAARAGADVLLFESNDRAGKPILATGNGRCNFSNLRPDQGDWHNAAFVERALAAHEAAWVRSLPNGRRDLEGPHAVADFFARLGMLWREEDGRLYPLTNKATTVVDVLRAALSSWGVEERCGRRAVSVRPLGGPDRDGRGGRAAERARSAGFELAFEDGGTVCADKVVLAAGGRIARRLAPDRLAFVRQHPVLGPLRTDTLPIKGLNNIRVHCAVSLRAPDGAEKAREEGEVLFRDYGLSGIAVFDLSRHAEPGDAVSIDFVPRVHDARAFLERRRDRMRTLHGNGRRPTLLDVTSGIVLPQVARCVLRQAGLDATASARPEGLDALAGALKGFSTEVRGVGDAKQCQVTRGGLDVAGFDPLTMEARALPGLYAAGEALDVDAACGGFNLHWAWASGLLAGRSAGESVCWEGKDA